MVIGTAVFEGYLAGEDASDACTLYHPFGAC